MQPDGRFDTLAGEFASRLAAIRDLCDAAFVRDDWATRNAQLEADLLPRPRPDLLAHPAIRFQMFVGSRYLVHELPYVLARVGDAGLLAEDDVGAPPLAPVPGTQLATSSNTVHHLHHLLRYEELTGRRVRDADVVVEWGAGYGNLAKLLGRLHGASPTVVLIDTPVFSAVQWLYLAAALGEDSVVLHTRAGQRPARGCFNVVPVGLAAGLDVRADLFLSTWALNESTQAAQALVIGRSWFGAESLLLGMHAGDPLAPDLLAAGALQAALGDFMPGQCYFVR
jgi:hypothetical protein